MQLQRRRYKNRFHKQKLVDLICQEIRIADKPFSSSDMAAHINKERIYDGNVTAEMIDREVATSGNSLKYETVAGKKLINVNLRSAVGND